MVPMLVLLLLIILPIFWVALTLTTHQWEHTPILIIVTLHLTSLIISNRVSSVQMRLTEKQEGLKYFFCVHGLITWFQINLEMYRCYLLPVVRIMAFIFFLKQNWKTFISK